MKPKKKWHWLRAMRTTAERRANGKRSDREQYQWIRARRSAAVLPTHYDDYQHGDQKSWKMIRKQQYYPNGRGKRHEISIQAGNCWWRGPWDFEEYCKDNSIPYAVEKVYKSVEKRRKIYEWEVARIVPAYHYVWGYQTIEGVGDKFGRIRKHQIGWQTITCRVDTGEWETYSYKTLVGYRLIWWSHKDIGVEHIIKASILLA